MRPEDARAARYSRCRALASIMGSPGSEPAASRGPDSGSGKPIEGATDANSASWAKNQLARQSHQATLPRRKSKPTPLSERTASGAPPSVSAISRTPDASALMRSTSSVQNDGGRRIAERAMKPLAPASIKAFACAATASTRRPSSAPGAGCITVGSGRLGSTAAAASSITWAKSSGAFLTSGLRAGTRATSRSSTGARPASLAAARRPRGGGMGPCRWSLSKPIAAIRASSAEAASPENRLATLE
jgi:hypothetical protein